MHKKKGLDGAELSFRAWEDLLADTKSPAAKALDGAKIFWMLGYLNPKPYRIFRAPRLTPEASF